MVFTTVSAYLLLLMIIYNIIISLLHDSCPDPPPGQEQSQLRSLILWIRIADTNVKTDPLSAAQQQQCWSPLLLENYMSLVIINFVHALRTRYGR